MQIFEGILFLSYFSDGLLFVVVVVFLALAAARYAALVFVVVPVSARPPSHQKATP